MIHESGGRCEILRISVLVSVCKLDKMRGAICGRSLTGRFDRFAYLLYNYTATEREGLRHMVSRAISIRHVARG